MNAAPSLTDAQRAAIVIMLIGEDEASAILSQFEPEELTSIGQTMCNIGDIDANSIAEALDCFISHAGDERLAAHDRPAHVQRLMNGAVGEAKAAHLMQIIAPPETSRSLEIARWLTPETLLRLLIGEHPQAIAVLLLLLEAEPSAQLLASLPSAQQSGVVERIARLGPVSGDAIAMLDDILSRRIAERFGTAALTLGGVREAAELINRAASGVSEVVIPEIDRRDTKLARAIEAEMFTFAMLMELATKDIGRLLRDVENSVLIDALKGLEEDDREPVYAAMSSRAADGVKDEIEERGRIRKADVEAAQQSMIETARKLAESGEINFGSQDGEYV